MQVIYQHLNKGVKVELEAFASLLSQLLDIFIKHTIIKGMLSSSMLKTMPVVMQKGYICLGELHIEVFNHITFGKRDILVYKKCSIGQLRVMNKKHVKQSYKIRNGAYNGQYNKNSCMVCISFALFQPQGYILIIFRESDIGTSQVQVFK